MSDVPAGLPAEDPGQDSPQRKERRIRVQLPVEVRGTDRNGARFNERTQSEDLCRQGAAFALSHDLEVGAELDIFIPLARPGRQVRAISPRRLLSGTFARPKEHASSESNSSALISALFFRNRWTPPDLAGFIF